MTNEARSHTINKGTASNAFYTASVTDEGNNDKIIKTSTVMRCQLMLTLVYEPAEGAC